MLWFHRKNKLEEMEDLLSDFRRHSKKTGGLRQWLAVFLMALFVVFLVIFLPLGYQSIKAADSILVIKKSQTEIVALAGAGDWRGAAAAAGRASGEIAILRSSLGRVGVIGYFPPAGNVLSETDKMLAGADKLVGGWQKIFTAFDEAGLTLGGDDFLGKLNASKAGILSAQADIAEAEKILAEVNLRRLKGFFDLKLSGTQELLSQLAKASEVSLPLAANLPDLLGYGREKTYLLVFENNMEMRPTGGFIGSYGVVTVKDGQIKSFFTDDVYNLDRFSEGKLNIAAPWPMLAYNKQKNWYLRDANWSPDWPTAAEQIAWFYHQEAAFAGRPDYRFDGVIALTPEVTADILAVLGPIMINDLEFSADNFAWDLEKFVEFDYLQAGIGKRDRKDIIGDLAEVILDKVYSLPAKDALKIFLALENNIREKQILVYLFDDDLREQFAGYDWTGEVKDSDSDYLLAIDSNLAALKTDKAMDKSIAYRLRLDENGNLIGRAELTYAHQEDYQKDLISRYRDYLRLYVPGGSWFLRAAIVEDGQERELDLTSDAQIGEELGKRYLALFFTVEPKSTKKIIIEYRLPENIQADYQARVYKLIVQKQAGTIGHNLKIDLNFTNPVASYYSDVPPAKFFGQDIGWETDLSVDREFLIKF